MHTAVSMIASNHDNNNGNGSKGRTNISEPLRPRLDMSPPRRVLFPRGSDLAVIAGDEDGGGDGSERFWLCRTLQHVHEGQGGFAVRWLERRKGRRGYERSMLSSRLERESVLCKVKLSRAGKGSKVTH